MNSRLITSAIFACLVCACAAQLSPFAYEQLQFANGGINPYQNGEQPKPYVNGLQQIDSGPEPIVNGGQSFFPDAQVPDCPLEIHPDTQTMFVMRNSLGEPEPRTCPSGTYFLRSACSCVHIPRDKCNRRPSAMGLGWYEESVFGVWIRRPCGPGSAFNAVTCYCSDTL